MAGGPVKVRALMTSGRVVMGGKRRFGFKAAFAVAVAIAAGVWWQSQRPVQQDIAAIGDDPDTPFAVLRCDARSSENGPALAVAFSRPLAPGQQLGDLMKVTDLGQAGGVAADGHVAGQWRLGDNPRQAYFSGVLPKRRYRIDVAAGVSARSGDLLAGPHQCEMLVDDMPPAWFFASRGTVLPAGQNGGLPVVTVNTPEVDVQFLRVEPAQLPGFLDKVYGIRRAATDDEGGEGDEGYDDYEDQGGIDLRGRTSGWYLDRLKGLSKSVYLGRFQTDDKPDRRHVSFLPVEQIAELQEPGVYVAVMQAPGSFSNEYQTTYFYVSDIGLHLHRNASRIDAFATSLKSGTALPRVEFEMLDGDGKRVATVTGDDAGHAVFDAVPANARLVIARRGRELSVVSLAEAALDLSEFDTTGLLPTNNKLFAYSGRDLYRPGETFDVSVLARDADGEPVAPQPITAVLKRPDGRTVSQRVWKPSPGPSGYFREAVAIAADAQTGAWTLELRADPAARRPDAVLRFKVEEFLPERMKLALRSDENVLMQGSPFELAVQGDYLFGAPAAGNRLLGSLAVERARQALPGKRPGYVFGDFADDGLKARRELDETTLDDAGRARITVPYEPGNARSPLSLRVSMSLLESAGRPVVRSIERAWWPAPALVAVRPLFDGDVARESSLAEFEVGRFLPDGAFAPLAKTNLRLFREERQYYWRFDDQRGWHSGFSESDELVDSRAIALTATAKVALPVSWGRYRLEIDDAEHGLTMRYRFYAGWGAQDGEALGNRPDRVQVRLEGAPYAAGDTVRAQIVPPHDGEALVLVEGDRVLWSKRVKVSAAGTTVDVPLDKGWKRHDLYLSVVAFRPGSEGGRVTPARALGLAHIPLSREARRLGVRIDAPARIEPDTTATVQIKVDGAAGEPAWVTLSAVDQGILNITRFATPDPFGYFFGKQRYGADLLDIYGRLIEKMDGTRSSLKWGGDAARRDTQSMPKKVKLIDLFSGPVQLDDKGEARIALAVPDFNGSLRLMAVASTAARFGHGERDMTVAAPIVAELSTPRFIAPGDEAAVALEVTNLTAATQQIRLALDAAPPVSIRDGARTMTLAPKQRSTVRFAATAVEAEGLAKLTLVLDASGGDKPVHLRREAALQVTPPVPLARTVQRVKVEPGARHVADASVLERFWPASATLSLTAASSPPLNIREHVRGLLRYPYGCAEQTVSSAWPHVIIDDAQAKELGLKVFSRAERVAMVDAAIGRLAGMQGAQGGMTMWGGGEYEHWITAYVAGFLIDAREAGFTVPEAFSTRMGDWMLKEFQLSPSQMPRLAGNSTQPGNRELLRGAHMRFANAAHLGYALAREQRAPLATLRLLFDEHRTLAKSPLALAHLGLALKLMGDDARAGVALDEALLKPYGLDGNEHEWLGDYGSALRDRAMMYALFERHDVKMARAANLLFELSADTAGRRWLSTQEQIALVLAGRAAGAGAGKPWALTLGGGEDFAGSTPMMLPPDAAAVRKGVDVVNTGTAPLYLEVEAAGYPKVAPATENGLGTVRRTLFDADGRPWSGRAMKVGDLMLVRVEVRPSRRVDDALLVDRLPAGLEIENLNLSQGPQASEFSLKPADGHALRVADTMNDGRVKHREFRDDRFVAALKLDSAPLNLVYMVRVVTPGRYTVPGTFMEDMYRPELRTVGEPGPLLDVVDVPSAAAR
jgi:alpha-2-macroglobulin